MAKRIRNIIGITILLGIVAYWVVGIVHDTWAAHGWNSLWILPLEVVAVIAFVNFMNYLLEN